MQRSDGVTERFLTPKWYISMVLGRYGFGDTFFTGMFGSGMVFAPVAFVLAAFVAVVVPDAMSGLIIAMSLLYAAFLTLLVPAIVMLGWRAKSAGGWRWFGMVLAIGMSAGAWALVNRYLGAG